MLIASYAAVGGGLLLVCQLVVAIPPTLLVLGMMLTSPARAVRPKFWVALLFVAQPIVLFFIFRELGTSSPYFDYIWAGSMLLIFVGLQVLVWPGKKDTN